MTISTPTAGPNVHTVPCWEEEMGHGKLGGETALGRGDQGESSLRDVRETHSGYPYKFGTWGKNLGWNQPFWS